jgi:hypothetical protein
MSKAGWLYAAGLTVIGVWLLTFLNSVQNPTMRQAITPTTSPTLPVSSPLALVPAQVPRYTPEPSVPILRATRVRSAIEEARIKKYVPTRVRLRQDLEFRAISQNSTKPSIFVGQGREVNVLRVAGPDLIVESSGWQAKVPIAKTDFLDRVIAEVER